MARFLLQCAGQISCQDFLDTRITDKPVKIAVTVERVGRSELAWSEVEEDPAQTLGVWGRVSDRQTGRRPVGRSSRDLSPERSAVAGSGNAVKHHLLAVLRLPLSVGRRCSGHSRVDARHSGHRSRRDIVNARPPAAVPVQRRNFAAHRRCPAARALHAILRIPAPPPVP